MKEDPKYNLKVQYKKVLELGLIASLVLHIFVFQGFKTIEEREVQTSFRLEAISVEDIPQTQQEKSAPAPSRPTVPIASEDETLPEDETIDFTDLDLDSEPPPPPPPPEVDSDMPMFIPHDEPPQPIGGYAAIQRGLVYPEIAKRKPKTWYEHGLTYWFDPDGNKKDNAPRIRILTEAIKELGGE